MNLASIIDGHPDGDAALITATGEVTTYGELRRAAAAWHQRLVERGVGPGDRVALLSANHPAFVVGYLAALRAGAITVPLNIASPTAEVARQLATVDVKALLAGPGASAVAASLGVAVISLNDGRVDDSEEGKDAPPPPVERDPSDVAALLFTAGTSGSPRAAMLTHANLLANLEQFQRHPGRALDAHDRALAVLPLSHIFGLNTVLGGALFIGAAVVLLDHFDPVATLDAIARHRVTIVVGAPTMFAALTAAGAQVEGQPLANARLAFSGAAPLSTEVANAWQRRFGLPLRQGYGLTEASPVVTAALVEGPSRPTSIGIPIPGVTVRLVDDDGDEALAGDPGEIWVKGTNVFPGYWNDPAATEIALTPDGWLRTGDIAVMGDDGELAIVDRAKDLVIVSGFNVYPAEVEEVLADHPGVSDVAVVGDEDRYRGESVHAYVVLTGADAASQAELKAWCRARLAPYKCPSKFTFVAALPHGLAGKLLRRSLRSAAAAG
ncbi:MAG: AMP-binding protein [Acidimicrobiales bacterium]